MLAKNGVEDFIILEASDRIGGRIRKENFGGVSVELGAGWIVGVGGRESNPVWELAAESDLRTCFSDYTNARYNIYERRSAENGYFRCFPLILRRFSLYCAVVAKAHTSVHSLRSRIFAVTVSSVFVRCFLLLCLLLCSVTCVITVCSEFSHCFSEI